MSPKILEKTQSWISKTASKVVKCWNITYIREYNSLPQFQRINVLFHNWTEKIKAWETLFKEAIGKKVEAHYSNVRSITRAWAIFRFIRNPGRLRFDILGRRNKNPNRDWTRTPSCNNPILIKLIPLLHMFKQRIITSHSRKMIENWFFPLLVIKVLLIIFTAKFEQPEKLKLHFSVHGSIVFLVSESKKSPSELPLIASEQEFKWWAGYHL